MVADLNHCKPYSLPHVTTYPSIYVVRNLSPHEPLNEQISTIQARATMNTHVGTVPDQKTKVNA